MFTKKQIKIFILIILLIIPLITWVLSNNLFCDKNLKPYDSYESFGLRHPMGVYYNGTLYIVQEINPVYFENRGDIFFITMQMTIKEYNYSLKLEPASPGLNYIIYPNYKNVENATYSLTNIPIELESNKYDYPYDTYVGNLTFFSETDKFGHIVLNFRDLEYSSSNWNLNIFGYHNALHFRFYRVSEIHTFEILSDIGKLVMVIILISYIFYILSCLIREITNINVSKKIAKNFILFGDMAFYVATLVGIPFYFGVVINKYILPNLFQNSECIVGLRNLMYILIIISTVTYGISKYIKEKN